MMFELLNHISCHFNAQKSMMHIPPYIDELLQHQLSKTEISLNVAELKSKYPWVRSIILKSDQDEYDLVLNFPNICRLFRNSDTIIFNMPKGYILSYSECIELITKDLPLISASDMSVIITLLWPEEMHQINKLRINEYQKELCQIQWKQTFSTNSVSFQCHGDSAIVQTLVEKTMATQQTLIVTQTAKKKIHSVTIRKQDINHNSEKKVKCFIK
eukprot:460421_1